MICCRCHDATAMKHKDVCGIFEVVEAGTMMADRPAAVPAHFNISLGEQIEDRTHLRKVRERKKREGIISAWD